MIRRTVAVALQLFLAVPSQAQTTFHGNISRTGFYADPGPKQFDFYRFVSIGAVVSSPVVDHGVVYFGSMDGKLYALK